jgi:hypothetical protein
MRYILPAVILPVVVFAVLPAAIAAAGLYDTPTPDKKAPAVVRQLPAKRSGGVNSCAAYGPGFVKADGTDTCVKIGGAISIDVGRSAGSR